MTEQPVRRGRPRKVAAPEMEAVLADNDPVEDEAPVEVEEAPTEPVIEDVVAVPDPAVSGVVVKPVRILKADEEVTFKGAVFNNEIVVLEEVLREVYPLNSKRPTRFLVYPYGARLAMTSVTQKQVEEVDTTGMDLTNHDTLVIEV